MIRRLLAIALLALFVPRELLAQSQAPAEQADRSEWIDPGWRRTIARHVITFDESGLSRAIFEFEILLTEPKGLKAVAQQTFRYNSYFQQLSLSNLATIKADGRIIPVDERAINDQPAFADPSSPYYDEQRIRTIAYPDVAPGDKVKGHLVYSDKRPLFPGEYADYWSQSQDGPPEVMELTLTGPASKPLQVVARGVEHTEERIGDRIVHHALFRRDTPRSLLSNTDDFDSARRFEVSTFKDYAAFASVIRAWNAPMAVPNESVRRLSSQIVGDAVDERTKAERIYSWVARHIRYVGIGFEGGGFTSQSASEILTSRYGDCKAHVTILKALLAVQGIEADFVVANLHPKYTITSVATPNFDHAIVYVPQFDLYLDPTYPIAAFGSLPTSLYGKPALNIDRGTLSSIPVAKPDEFVIRDDTAYTLGLDGRRKAKSALFGAGIGANLGRAFAQYLENSDRVRIAEQKIRNAGLEGTGNYTFSDPREPSGTFTISAPFEITQPVPLDKRARVRMLPLTDPRPSLRELISGGVRDKAFRCSSLDYSATASLELPEGTNLEEKPRTLGYTKDFTGQTNYGPVNGRVEMSGTTVFDGRTVRAAGHLRFVFNAPVCPREFVGEIDFALAKWDKFHHGAIGLTPRPVSRVVETGSNYDVGLDAYRREHYVAALKEWTPIAEDGDVDAQVYLGSMYLDGKGVSQDYKRAIEWYTKAAEQGNELAQSQLGHLYNNGLGVPTDHRQALQWFRKAAERGYAYAQCSLGEMYENAKGVPQDYKQAMVWYAKAAGQGSTRAQYLLGLMHENGKGIPHDHRRAAEWYRKSAEHGYSWAQVALGTVYAYGRGVTQDYKLAVEWYRKAADQGFAAAQYNLGYAYENGFGVDPDRQQAMEWYRRAANQGYASALDRLNSMNAGGALMGVLKRIMDFAVR